MARFALAVLALTIVTSAPLLAQEEEKFDRAEAIKKIKTDLDKAVETLAELSGTGLNGEAGKRAVENIDKLLDGMQSSQGQIVDNIDQLIRNMKQSKSKSKGKGKESKSSKSKPKNNQSQQKRNRNQKPQDKKREGKKDQPKNGEKPEGGEEDKEPKQGKQPRKAPGADEEKVPIIDDSQAWGMLPPEVRQLLIENNFRDYFPDYQKEIADYLKSLNRRR